MVDTTSIHYTVHTTLTCFKVDMFKVERPHTEIAVVRSSHTERVISIYAIYSNTTTYNGNIYVFYSNTTTYNGNIIYAIYSNVYMLFIEMYICVIYSNVYMCYL